MRPAIVVSNDRYNTSDDCILVALTSVARSSALPIAEGDVEAGMLFRQSYVRADHIVTLSQSLIRLRLGRISTTAFFRVKDAILRSF